MKIKGTFKIPGIFKEPLITREINIDDSLYKKSVDKKRFIEQSFIHAIANELEVDCVVVK